MKRILRAFTAGFMALLVTASPGMLQTTSAREAGAATPALSVSTREIDLGVLGPGERSRAQFQIANVGRGVIRWSIEEPPGWGRSTDETLSGECGAAGSRVEVVLISLKGRPEAGDHAVQMRILSGRNAQVLQKNLTEGSYREPLKIESDEGSRTVFVKFSLSDAKSRPVLEVDPRGLDLGEVEPVKEVTRRIRITNGGAGVLRWQAASSGAGTARVVPETGRGRYVSLFHEGLTADGPYTIPGPVKETLQATGNWIVEKGYPKATGAGCSLRFQFQGAGAVLYGKKGSGNTVIRISADDRPATEATLQSLEGDRFEVDLGEVLTEGLHSLQIQIEEGVAILEGFFVMDSRAAALPPAWVRLTPLSGTTTRETDFVAVRMNLSELKPGIYTDYFTVTSNGGTAHIPVSLIITGEPAPKVLNVYRFTRGPDQLFTAQPDKEDPNYLGAYQREGLAFRLYSPGTAGTMELYRWYNPSIGDHYYSGERSGGRKNLAGYLFEGAIGNIATIRLPGTKEIYRWFNASTGHHFFTVDAAGEGMGRKGYQFEGIVGFVLR